MASQTAPDERFIVLKADMTGDLWHVAAACALWPPCRKKAESLGQAEALPLLGWQPRPAIIVWENIKANHARDGETAFTYLQSISLRPVVVMIPEQDEKLLDTLTHAYIQSVAMEFDQGGPYTWGTANDIAVSQVSKAPTPNRNTNGPKNDKRLVPLAATTAMVMQMMDLLDRPTALKLLGDALSAELSEKAKAAAQSMVDRLAALVASTRAEKVVLLNYRQGEVNKQHNTNEKIKDSLKDHASLLTYPTTVISIPQMREMAPKILEDRDRRPGPKKDWIFDLYGLVDQNAARLPDDRRAKVWFWKLVAEQLQSGSVVVDGSLPAPVVGMIGGRSGSMDLPSFVGVRCMSWDEPLLARNVREGLSKNDIKNVREQASQILRLLNQWPLMSMSYIDIWNPKAKNLIWDDGRIRQWLGASSSDNDQPADRALPIFGGNDLDIVVRPSPQKVVASAKWPCRSRTSAMACG